jgi:hypothetical protein
MKLKDGEVVCLGVNPALCGVQCKWFLNPFGGTGNAGNAQAF